MLFAKHDSDSYVGLAILLPDWQRSGQLWQLTRALWLGFDTLLLLPRPSKPNWTPPPRKAAGHRRLSQAVRHPYQQAGDAKLQEGLQADTGARHRRRLGHQPHRQRTAARPDALVLLDGFFPDQQSNQIFAKEIAQATMPTLDLYQEDGGRWPLLAAEARRSESRRSHKLNYRPYALLELDETPTRIQGWLTHLGWL